MYIKKYNIMKSFVPLLTLFLIVFTINGVSQTVTDSQWKKTEKILASIQEPKFPEKVYNVVDFGQKATAKPKTRKPFRQLLINAAPMEADRCWLQTAIT